MTYRVVFEEQVAEDLSALPVSVRRSLVQKLEALTEDPRPAAAMALTGNLKGFWRLRVGDYRAAYTIDQKTCTVQVRNVGHRKRFYDQMRRKKR